MLEDGFSYPLRDDWIGRIVIGGVLGWLGLQGTITPREFLLAFGAVTVVALIWRASITRGRGL